MVPRTLTSWPISVRTRNITFGGRGGLLGWREDGSVALVVGKRRASKARESLLEAQWSLESRAGAGDRWDRFRCSIGISYETCAERAPIGTAPDEEPAAASMSKPIPRSPAKVSEEWAVARDHRRLVPIHARRPSP